MNADRLLCRHLKAIGPCSRLGWCSGYCPNARIRAGDSGTGDRIRLAIRCTTFLIAVFAGVLPRAPRLPRSLPSGKAVRLPPDLPNFPRREFRPQRRCGFAHTLGAFH